MYALVNLRRPDTNGHTTLPPNNIRLYESRRILINKGQENSFKKTNEIIAKVTKQHSLLL